MTGQRAGDVVVFHVRRDGEELTLPVTLGAAPLEQADDLELIYDIVELPGARLRSIVSRPLGAEGRLPAVLFVQGLTCGSVEQPFGPPNTVTQLIHGLTRAGFAVMRCEKSGVGDSEGEPCSEIGFHREVEGFHAALLALKEYDFVDRGNVFLFGHSMGGMEGPIVAVEEPVRGVMVYGTGVLPWGEYLIANTRRQARLDPETDLGDLEAQLRDRARFYHYLFREGMEVADIAAAHPELADIGAEDFPDGTHGYTRHVQFFRELDAVNSAAIWQELQAPVLALYGEYDFATSREEHDYIAEIVNRVRPGTAKVVEFPGLFHAFNRRDSMEETLANPWAGEFGEEVVTTCVDWMHEVMATPGS
jgi:pimeloyl-ACP methyl ester carboxylesterase